MLHDTLLVYAELQLDPVDVQGLLTRLQELRGPDHQLEVLAEKRGGMRVPFSDPRRYLVGRSSQLETVSKQLRAELLWARMLLYSESGTGKTVTANAIAFEVCMSAVH